MIGTRTIESCPPAEERYLPCVARGDAAALAALYERYRKDVYRYALALTRRHEPAEDITQDVFLTAATKGGSCRGSERSWLLSIAHNRAVNLLRKEERARRRDEVPEESVPPASQMELFDSLKPLTDRQRAVVLLRIGYGLSHKETAAALKISHAAVRKQYERALAVLRETVPDAL